mmetsp:Transcript_13331/g.28938  ORF Transcript_13331/g.28938 Transcript_13331/m.28938 type:complete len:142 (-) Transcript_13331:442-867(-)
MYRNPKQKITEPKTPFHGAEPDEEDESDGCVASNAQEGSSEGPSMIDDSKLQGFSELESNYISSARATRSVGSSGARSTPHSSEEFARMRKMHYHNEFVRIGKDVDELANESEQGDNDEYKEGEENAGPAPNSAESEKPKQ